LLTIDLNQKLGQENAKLKKRLPCRTRWTSSGV
jgi:hypothetical protein